MKFVRLTTKSGMYIYVNLAQCVDIHWSENDRMTYITAVNNEDDTCIGVIEKPESFLAGLYELPCEGGIN